MAPIWTNSGAEQTAALGEGYFVIKLRGLPWGVTIEDIVTFLAPIPVPQGGVHLMNGANGRLAIPKSEVTTKKMLKVRQEAGKTGDRGSGYETAGKCGGAGSPAAGATLCDAAVCCPSGYLCGKVPLTAPHYNVCVKA